VWKNKTGHNLGKYTGLWPVCSLIIIKEIFNFKNINICYNQQRFIIKPIELSIKGYVK